VSKEEEEVIVCVASSEWHTADSQLLQATCGHTVWASAGAREYLVAKPQTGTMCMPCATKMAEGEEMPDVKIPEWAEEVARTMGIDAAQVREAWIAKAKEESDG
jgi:hypothetical protein